MTMPGPAPSADPAAHGGGPGRAAVGPGADETIEDLYEQAPCGYLTTLPDGMINRVNQTFLGLTGHGREALLSRCRVQDLMTVPGRVYFETHVWPLLRLQGAVKEIACDLQRPGRGPLPVQMSCAEVRDAAGQVHSMRFTFFDASDRRRFENELQRARQNAEHFKVIVDASADAILSVGPEGQVQSWNPAAERLFGQSASQALGRLVSELIMPDDPAASFAAVLPSLRAGQSVHRETECSRPDGQRLTVSITLSPHLLPPQALIGVSVIVRDMTQQALAQARLRDSEEQFRTIFELTPAGVVLIEPASGTILACNEEAARGCGYTREEFIGRPVRDVVAPAYRLQSTARRDRVLATGGDAFETQHITRSGELRDVEVKVQVVTIRGERRLLSVWEDVTLRVRSQAALRASQERLAFGVRLAGLALADVNYQTGQVALSVEAARLFGFGERAQSVSREHMHQAFHPDDRAEILRRIEDSLAPDSSGWFAMELRVLGPTGQQRWLRVRKQVLFEQAPVGQRRPVAALIAALDISAEKAAEEAVRNSEVRFRSIFENAAVGIAHVGVDGRFLRVNPRFCRITGYEEAELSGLTFADITHVEDQAIDRVQLARLLANEVDTFGREKRYHRKSGAVVWANLTVSVLRDRAGQPLHLIAVVEDISAKRAALDALEQQRQFVERLTEVLPSILYVFDIVARRHVWVNRQAGAALGYLDDQAGQWGSDFRFDNLHPDDRARVESDAAALAYLADGQTQETEYRLRHRSGQWRWFHSRETVFKRDTAGRVLEVIGVAADIDVSKRATQALRDADQKKDDFIATLAHELRNPLAPIRNAVRVLQQKGPQDPELIWCRSIIERQVAQMAHLLEDLLDVSRIARGRLTLRRERLSVATFIEQAVEIARPVIDARGHVLSIALPPQPVAVDGDLTRLGQIFSNLLINAAKYTDHGGRIALTAVTDGDQLLVTVVDNGHGIAADRLGHIFEMFNQVEPALARSQDGLGIGLSLVRALVTLHGGEVSARSAGRQQGSQFSVRLPVAAALSESTPLADGIEPSAQAAVTGKSAGLRVLVADDSRDIAESLEMLLTMDGFEVVVAYDGEQAFALAQAQRPDVALLDLGMPKLNGYQVAERIRNQPWGGQMTLIAQTGWGHAADRQRTREAGFDHHIVKPVDPTSLTALLCEVAGKARPAP